VKNNDRFGWRKVLAADMVFFSGGPAFAWDLVQPRYQINHRRRNDPTRPGFQNILYADGHVDGKGPDYYPSPLNVTSNFSLQHATAPVGGFIYWGPTLAAKVTAPPRTGPAAAPPTTPPAPPPTPWPFP